METEELDLLHVIFHLKEQTSSEVELMETSRTSP